MEKARTILQKEIVAVIGYGVQGPGQALNMRDNGIKVIVGQREGGPSWEKAIQDGFVPGETLFSPEEAARKGSVVALSVVVTAHHKPYYTASIPRLGQAARPRHPFPRHYHPPRSSDHSLRHARGALAGVKTPLGMPGHLP